MGSSSKPSDWVLFVYMKPADFLGYLLIHLKQTSLLYPAESK